jgi:sulfur dioxygenase
MLLGSSETLYHSVHDKLFTLPDEVAVYPAHDYKGRTSSSIWEEKHHNPRLTKSLEEFVAIMAALNLPYPKKIDASVPSNLQCGIID